MAELDPNAHAAQTFPDDPAKIRLLALLNELANGDLAAADPARAERLTAIMTTFGKWKDDPDKPHDALAYQRDVRAEWR